MMDIKLTRIDYLQVGLTSSNTLKIINPGSSDNQMTVIAVVGDHTGCVHCFSIRDDSTNVNTIFKTLPGSNAKINSVQVINVSSLSSSSHTSGLIAASSSRSPKILVSFGSSVIRGYTSKGKQFFGLELNNLTEPIKHLQVKWPSDIFISGQFIYNHYLLSSTLSDDHNKASVIQSKNFYVSPGKITGLIIAKHPSSHETVSIIACEDRLIRILNQSICEYEIETCGIPNTMCPLAKCGSKSENLFLYGTLEGKVSLVSLDFDRNLMAAIHKWEIPEKGSRAQVTCLTIQESTGELYIGRSNGAIELWIFSETLDADGNQSMDIYSSPIFRTEYNCGESLTSICICRNGTLLLCSTFSGFIFGLIRNDMLIPSTHASVGNEASKIQLLSQDAQAKIESLKAEIHTLEKRLQREQEIYQEMTSISNYKTSDHHNRSNFSALSYFAIDDSMILHQDASYLLTFGTEVAIDSAVVQCDIPLDLVDCDRNSAVISFNDDNFGEVLATFRCQANTTRLEVKIRSIEGQLGHLRVYITTQMTPKSCQVKQYTIKALSLHKRSYTNDDPESGKYLNKLRIYGSFSMNEAFSWLQMCLPEIPERISSMSSSSSITYTFVSTLVGTTLTVTCSKGSLMFESDNISTISILKDFITREATKKSIPIEMEVNVNQDSIGHTIRKIYPRLETLSKMKRHRMLTEAVNELKINDSEIAASLAKEIDEPFEEWEGCPSLERLYGLITDLFIDYSKVDGLSKITINSIKNRMTELTNIIATYSTSAYKDEKVLVEKLNEFWNFQNVKT